MAALGGTWMTAVFGFAGLSLHGEEIAFDPKLPASWRCLAFAIEWRGRQLKIRIEADHLQAMLEAGDPITLVLSGRRYELQRDYAAVCPLPPRV
jgi:trehalose/maltose hydrolase-like predicted phosphorylase